MSPLALTSLIAALAAAVALAVQPAVASPTLPPVSDWVPTGAFDEEEEEAEAESEVEDWAEEEEEAEPPPGNVCPLRSASAHAVTKHDKLKLTIGYTTNEPFSAGIEIKRGPTRIDSVQRHFGRSGVLRFNSSRLSGKQAGRLVIRIRPASGGSGCPSRRLVLFPR